MYVGPAECRQWEGTSTTLNCACSVAAIRVHSPKTNGLYTLHVWRRAAESITHQFFSSLPINCCIIFRFQYHNERIRRFQFFGKCDQNDWRERKEKRKKLYEINCRQPAEVPERPGTATAQHSPNLSLNNRDLVWWCRLFDVAARANVERVPSRDDVFARYAALHQSEGRSRMHRLLNRMPLPCMHGP